MIPTYKTKSETYYIIKKPKFKIILQLGKQRLLGLLLMVIGVVSFILLHAEDVTIGFVLIAMGMAVVFTSEVIL